MSPTRTELVKWLATKDVDGSTLDIGGDIWSMKGKVKSFDGLYAPLDETNMDLNLALQSVLIGTRGSNLWDNIFCTEVMQFLFNPYNALRNFRTMLVTGGKLYISFHLTHPPMKSHDYLRYTEKGIRKLLEVTGFQIDEFLEPLPGYFLVQCSR